MRQILDFSIEIFDIRNSNVVKVDDDRGLVKNIQIKKNLQLDNVANITFAKSRSYALLNIEESIKLYNYVKIHLKIKNYETGKDNKYQDFYFSGFIQNASKQTIYGQKPQSIVILTIVDFANLFKTTFYTKNLTFFNILQIAVPEFRLLNFQEVFNDPSNKLLNEFYSLNQMGFIFFSFFYFKFLYNIVYEKPGEEKKIGEDNVFKKFKLFMPFGFPLKDKSGKVIKSLFDSQSSSLIIYKKLQGVALDLYKYLYPEPVFEFSTYETEDSVILIIRPTPFMKFDRSLKDKITLSSSQKIGVAGDIGDKDIYGEKEFYVEGSVDDIDSFNVIEKEDFGHLRIAKFNEVFGVLPNIQIKDHLQPIINTINETLEYTKKLSIDDLIANETETTGIIDNYYKIIPFDIRFLENISMSRSANSVVNVVWVTPATDTAVLQTAGRSLVYGLLGKKLDSYGGDPNDSWKKYIANQYITDENPNPAFFWNYKNLNPDRYVSGDINYFGLREFEIKWNCLTLYDASVYFVMNYIDKEILKKIKERSTDDYISEILRNALKSNVQKLDEDTETKTTKSKTTKSKKPRGYVNTQPPEKIGIFYKNAFKDPDFKAAIDSIGDKQIKLITSNPDEELPKFIRKMKDEGANVLGSFAAKLNGIISSAYRENEHLYDCKILKPIDLSIMPGMIVNSTYPNDERFNNPKFKGYVTEVSHVIDFHIATMKSNFTLTRTASNDSTLVIQQGVE